MRNYVDAQLCFAEIKLKGKRGQTEKQRIACAPDQYGRLDPQTEARIRAAYRDLYARELTQTLEPIVSMRYRRMTLVAKEGGERMTIDRSMVFMDGTGTYRVGEELVIVETKSATPMALPTRFSAPCTSTPPTVPPSTASAWLRCARSQVQQAATGTAQA